MSSERVILVLSKLKEVAISTSPYEDLISSLSGKNAFQFLVDITRIGNRWLGTKDGSKARKYLQQRFAALGLDDVHTEDFHYLNYSPKICRLQIIHPVRQTIDCQPLEYSSDR